MGIRGNTMTKTRTHASVWLDLKAVWSLRRAFYVIVLTSIILWITVWKSMSYLF